MCGTLWPHWESLGLHGTQFVNTHSDVKEEATVMKHWVCRPKLRNDSWLYLCFCDPP